MNVAPRRNLTGANMTSLRSKHFASLFVVLFILPSLLFAQNKNLSANLKEIEAYAAKAGQDWRVPGFAVAIVYYSAGFKEGNPREWQRWLAVALFTLAAVTDGVDGYLARHFNQRTRLGSILDPVADKALLLTALLTLSWNPGRAFEQLPLWFPIVILSRDVLVVFGVALVYIMARPFDVRPHWIGKIAAVLQMIVLGLVLLKAPDSCWLSLLWAAGICTIVSGGIYVIQGSRMLVADQSRRL